jgi:ubiquinol-cytochrome c reductase iron-sulfur subunit
MTDVHRQPPLAGSAGVSDRSTTSRRHFLLATTAIVGAVGAIAATWPLIDQSNPDAHTRAARETVEFDLADLLPAQQRLVHWKNVLIFVVRRTAGMLAEMQDTTSVARLMDPNSETRQQPAYARNWHRSIDPEYAVLVGVCTRCGCVPSYLAEASPPDLVGGYVCPCCASHYDPAGRAYSGPAQYNLPIPPYEIVDRTRILIGKNASRDDYFSLESIERI